MFVVATGYQTYRYPGKPKPWGWVVTALLIAAVTGVAFFVIPQYAGFLGGSLWLILYLLPQVGMRMIQRLLFQQKYARARAWLRLTSWLHPSNMTREWSTILQSFQMIREGKGKEIETELEKYRDGKNPVHRPIYSYFLMVSGKNREFLEWVSESIGEENLHRYPDLVPTYLLSLGETGRLETLVSAFPRFRKLFSTPAAASFLGLCRLYYFAYTGRREQVDMVFSGPLSAFTPERKTFWLAVADQAAGETGKAMDTMHGLLEKENAHLQEVYITRHLETTVTPVTGLGPDLEAEIEKEAELLRQESKFTDVVGGARHRERKPLMTYIMMGLILLGFAVQLYRGSATDPEIAFRLGAMVKWPGHMGEWWRTVTSLFLHFGPLHLLLNLVSLFLIGPYAERFLGKIRWLTVYLVSGCTAMYLAAEVARGRILLTGASGSIMGLMGVSIFILLRGLIVEKARVASRSLYLLGLILAIQILNDISTPKISLSAHIFGLIAGFLAALVLYPGRGRGNK